MTTPNSPRPSPSFVADIYEADRIKRQSIDWERLHIASDRRAPVFFRPKVRGDCMERRGIPVRVERGAIARRV